MTFNTGYVGVNSNVLANAGCYVVINDGQFFDIACVFAANLVWNAEAGRAELSFNPQVSHTLDGTNDVAFLQSKGIKVLLSVLNNHDQAGWSCFTTPDSAAYFVKQLADCVGVYGLDGIDIDDEYSNGQPNVTSLIMVTAMMKQAMPGKIISKALFQDIPYFQATWNNMTLAENLTYGWEMSYWDPDGQGRLAPYIAAGMSPSQLAIGVSTDSNSPQTAGQMAQIVQANGYGGMMVFDVGTTAAPMLSAISQVFDNQPTTATPNCLRQSSAAVPEPSGGTRPRLGFFQWLRRLFGLR